MEVPQRDPEAEPLVGGGSPRAHSILKIFGCQTMHNLVHFAVGLATGKDAEPAKVPLCILEVYL